MNGEELTGVVKTKTAKGFGFILIDGQEKEVFFHHSSLVGVTFDEIQEGDKVTFHTEEGPKGTNAANVQRAPAA